MLELRDVGSGYGGLRVISEVSLTVREGEWVAIVGAAGAGKSTLMRTIAGSLEALDGTVRFRGDDLARVPAYERVRRGISLVPEGRRLFRGMTVAENLTAGAFVCPRAEVGARLEQVYTLFPALAERGRQQVGTLSGGEQQMCAIGRSLMSRPSLLLVDELSLGLAPNVVDALIDALERIRAEGATLVVVEQDVELSLAHADRGYVMRHGRVVSEGASADLLADRAFLHEYMGVAV